MNKNQEKEMMGLLGTLISEVRDIKSEVGEIRKIQNEHSIILNEHSAILNEHGKKLDLLVARTDDIATTVIVNDKRLTEVEKDVTDIRSGVH